MASLNVISQDGMYQISSQDFCLQFPNTEKNTRVLWLLLRAFHDPDTGKPVFTHEQIAKAFGYTHRQNIQNFEQEFSTFPRLSVEDNLLLGGLDISKRPKISETAITRGV